MHKKYFVLIAMLSLWLTACGNSELSTTSNDGKAEIAETVEYMVSCKLVSKEEYDQSKLETNALSILSDNGQSLNYESKEFGENNTVIFHYEEGITIIVEENGSISIETPAKSEIPE